MGVIKYKFGLKKMCKKNVLNKKMVLRRKIESKKILGQKKIVLNKYYFKQMG